MATQFTIDDAFVLEGDEEGVVTDGEPQGWKDREGGEMTFGPLSFSKPQNHPSPAAASPEPTNLKYQVACTQHCLHFCFHVAVTFPVRGCLIPF